MQEFFTSILDFFSDIFVVLGSYRFNMYGVTVSIFDILLALLVTSMVISVFWKGAKG